MTEQAKGYVNASYLQEAAKLLEPLKQYSYALMQVEAGRTVLDVGCGTGIDTVTLGQWVGPTGRVVGIDHDPAMIAAANQRAKQAGVNACVEHWHASAMELPFADNTFDACRSERLFMHLSNPDLALQDMVRVTKSSGWVVVADPDWGTSSIDTNEIEIERRLARFRAESMMHNGYAGRQLYRLFKQRRIMDISVKLFPIYTTDYRLTRQIERLDVVEQEALDAGIVSNDELQRWHASLMQADRAGLFFSSTCIVMVAGRMP